LNDRNRQVSWLSDHYSRLTFPDDIHFPDDIQWYILAQTHRSQLRGQRRIMEKSLPASLLIPFLGTCYNAGYAAMQQKRQAGKPH
jgi:hypothetical protein